MLERQELYCHGCGRYVQFNLDLSLNGNHTLACPNCGHQHCRVVKDGRITGIRWGQMNGPTIPINTYTTGTTSSYASTYDTYSGSDYGTAGSGFLYNSWMQTTATTGG